MATYKGISGFNIKSLATDPSNLLEGEIWYNSTSGTLKVAPLVASWASGNNMNTAHDSAALAAGTKTAALVAGGSQPNDTATEEYNGSSWTVETSMSTPRNYANGGGPQTAAMVVAGNIPAGPPTTDGSAVENYNGSSWTSGTAVSTPRYGHGSAGIQTAMVVWAGGQNPPLINVTEEYDGSSWTTTGTYPVSIQQASGTGTQTAAVGIGGADYSLINTVAQYDGSSWTAATAYPITVLQVGVNGTQTAALSAGGVGPGPANTSFSFNYDGSSWASDASLSEAGTSKGLNGTTPSTSAFIVNTHGGVTTEEYIKVATAETVTTS